jgi:3'(2'), 5'-bisphosphate nucleotidase
VSNPANNLKKQALAKDDGLLGCVVDIAEQAAGAIMRVYATRFAVRHKADGSPVTEADLAADALISEGLALLLPTCPVLSEESEIPSFEVRTRWKRLWLVDPLDGTQGFVGRTGEFAVNIALIEDHRPTLGVVYAPTDCSCYYARSGCGAFRRDPDGTHERLSVRATALPPIRVATSYSRRNPLTNGFIERLGAVRIERLGSALKSCRVAEGRADVYPGFSRTSEWDTAAAQCIVEEAGGQVVDTAGRPLRYNTRPSVDNPRFLATGDTRRDWTRDIPRE